MSQSAPATNEPVRLPTLALWLLLSLIGVYLVFVAGGFPGIYQVQWRLVTHALTLLVIVGWLIAILWRPDIFVRPRLTLPIAVVLGAMVVSTVASPYPRFGWETVVNAAATALVFAALVTMLARPSLRPRLRFTAAALVVGVVVAYAVELGWRWIEFWNIAGAITVPPLRPAFAGLSFGTPNIPAGVVVAFLPLVLAWIHGLNIPARTRWVAIGALVAVGFFDLVASGSRGAQLGFVVMSGAAVGLAAVDRRQRLGRVLPSRATGRWLWVGLAGFAALLVVAVPVGPRIIGRFTESGAEHRLVFWRESLAALATHPMSGTGPGTWALAHWTYTAPNQSLDVIAHAHNVAIQLGAEMGIIGLVAAGVFVLGVSGLMSRAWSAMARAEVAAITAGLAGLLAQNMVDNFSDLPLYVAGVAFLLAWVEGAIAPRATVTAPRIRLGAIASLTVVVVIAASIALPWDRAAAAYTAGVDAQNVGDWSTADQHYSRALELDPEYLYYLGATGLSKAYLGRSTEAAADLARAGLALHDPFLTIQAAELRADDGQALAPDAERLLAAATDGGYANVRLALGAGRVAERLGRDRQAVDFYSTALALAPGLAASAYWDAADRPVSATDQFEAAIGHAASLEGADVDPALVAVYVWLWAGDFGRARASVDALPAGHEHDLYSDLVAAVSGDSQALSRLKSASASDPLGPAVAAAAMATNAVADPDADRYRRWVANLASGSDRAGRRAVIVGAGGTETPLYGDANPGVAEQVYLRERGIVTLVPGVPQVAYR